MKKELKSAETKAQFIQSIYNWLQKTLKDMGNEAYSSCFQIEGSSIMCRLPVDFFNNYTIPQDTKIEMKFVTKKA